VTGGWGNRHWGRACCCRGGGRTAKLMVCPAKTADTLASRCCCYFWCCCPCAPVCRARAGGASDDGERAGAAHDAREGGPGSGVEQRGAGGAPAGGRSRDRAVPRAVRASHPPSPLPHAVVDACSSLRHPACAARGGGGRGRAGLRLPVDETAWVSVGLSCGPARAWAGVTSRSLPLFLPLSLSLSLSFSLSLSLVPVP
jgi:hypothetical protein